jgi:hypothetical protein
MPYLNNIPQATDQLKNSQPALLGNFISIKQLIDVDHSTFGAATEGKHEKVTMPIQGASPATLAGELSLFSRTSTLSGVPEMAFRRQTNGAVTEFTSSLKANVGWTRLPSGILLKWGRVNSIGAGLVTYAFPVAATIPAFVGLYSISLTPLYTQAGDNPNYTVRLNNFPTPLAFTFYSSTRTAAGPGGCGFTYIAIGI